MKKRGKMKRREGGGGGGGGRRGRSGRRGERMRRRGKGKNRYTCSSQFMFIPTCERRSTWQFPQQHLQDSPWFFLPET